MTEKQQLRLDVLQVFAYGVFLGLALAEWAMKRGTTGELEKETS